MIIKLKPTLIPTFGDIRIIKRFALLPRFLDENTIVWLQSYIEEQKYDRIPNEYGGFYYYWIKTKRWLP